MRKRVLGLFGFIVLALIGGLVYWNFDANSASAQTKEVLEAENFGISEYNARNEFSLTQGGTTGVWNYGYSTSDTDNTFTQFTQTRTNISCGGSNYEDWYRPNDEPFDLPLLRRNPGTVPCGNLPSEMLLLHPSQSGRRSVLRWTAPTAGTFLVNGVFQGLESGGGGTTTDVKILKNTTETLFSGNVFGYNTQQPFSLTVTAAVGDTLDFSVGFGNGDEGFDSTGLALTIGQPITACLTAPTNLAVYVPAENSTADVIGQNFNGSLVGNAFYANTGKVGRAFNFDGVGDYVTLPDKNNQDMTGDLTLEAWINPTISTGSQRTIISKRDFSGENVNYALFLESSGALTFSLRVGAGVFNTVSAPGVIPAGVYTHVAVTLSGTDLIFYQNGVETFRTNYVITHPASSGEFQIGGTAINGFVGSFFQGQIDEVSIYNRVLSQAELFDITKQGNFGKCPPANCANTPPNLVSWFQGETNALDSRSNNHGTNNGATFTNGKVGEGFNLNGSGQHLTFGNTLGNFGTGDFAVEFWIQTTNNRLEEILSKRVCGIGNGIHYFDIRKFNDGRILAEIGSSSGAVALFSTQTVTDGNFHHIAVQRSGDTFALYIDGVLETSGTGAALYNINNGAPFVIGALACIGVDTTQPFTGIIDEVSLYSKALSVSEISSFNIAGQSGKCKPSPLNPTANQIAWFTGDGDARDFSGNNNNGAFVGSSSFAVGKVGQDFNFTGGQTVQAPDNATLDFTNAFTIETWVSPTAAGLGTQQTFFVSKGNMNFGNTQSYGILFYQDRRIGNRVGNGSAFATLDSTAQLPLNTFTHIATTYDGSTLRVYINGVLDSSQATSIGTLLNSGQPLILGGGNFGGSTVNAQSEIDEVSLYNRALSPSELAAIYNAGTAGKLKSAATPVNFARNARTSANLAPTTVQLSDATVNFAQVTTAGTTSENSIDLGLLPKLPTGLTSTGLAYDVSTTAAFTSAAVCFNLPSLAGFTLTNLRVLHLEGGIWINRTAAANTLQNFCTVNLTSLSPFVIVEALAPTAANVSVGGRVVTAEGSGISYAIVTLTDIQGNSRTVRTNSFGRFTFYEVAVGETYIISIQSKRFVFSQNAQVVNVMEAINEIVFTADFENSSIR